jgi:hypothetical protein
VTDQRTWAVYADQVVQSPSGRFRLASTTEVDEPDFAIFAELRLTMFEGERVLWTHAGDGSAQRLWVDDDGWAAVLLGDDRVMLFDQEGRVVDRADALALLREDPRSAWFILGTTAGDYWDSRPLGVLARCEGVPYFSLRTYWGARIVLRGDRGTQLSPTCAATLREAELAAARARLEALRPPLGYALGAAQAATLLSLEGCRAVIPALERGSQLLPETYMFTGITEVRGARDGNLGYSPYTLRIACGLALIRLGCPPPRAAGYRLIWDRDDAGLFDRPQDWLEQREQLQAGLTHAELLARVGAPTYLQMQSQSRSTWWYDAPGLSVGVELDHGVVDAVHVDHEQAWISTLERERMLFF